MDVHVPGSELRRDRAEVVLERGLALVHDERDAAHEKDEGRKGEPHVTKIGNRRLGVDGFQPPATAATTRTVWPSATEVCRPLSCRTSEPST